MIEANPAKFYVVRYFFCVLALLQWLVAGIIYFKYPPVLKNQYAALFFATMGSILFVFYLIIREKVRRVAISKKKIIVISSNKKQKIEWSEVRSLKLIPFINMYRLKIKGRKKGIYFFPAKNVNPVYGFLGYDTSKMGALLKKLNPN